MNKSREPACTNISSREGSMENIITYKTTNLFSTPDLVSLFTSVGWVNESAEYPNRLENAMYHSDIVFSAWDGDKLVGLLSTISDTMHVYITYLLVDPSYQNRKIGTKLLNMFEKHYVNYKKELKTEKASDYYKRFGWHSDSVGMVKNNLPLYDY